MVDEKQDKGFKVVDRRGHVEEPAAAPKAEPASAEPPEERPSLEIDFGTFVLSLGSSVLVHLGELSGPGEEAPHRDLALAKQTIDILGMLHDKTKGNLTAEEARLLEHLLYDLRLKYVEAKKLG